MAVRKWWTARSRWVRRMLTILAGSALTAMLGAVANGIVTDALASPHVVLRTMRFGGDGNLTLTLVLHNEGTRRAVFEGAEARVHHAWDISNKGCNLGSMLNARRTTASYDLALRHDAPYADFFAFDHDLAPDETDQFDVRLQWPANDSLALFALTLKFHYQEGRVVESLPTLAVVTRVTPPYYTGYNESSGRWDCFKTAPPEFRAAVLKDKGAADEIQQFLSWRTLKHPLTDGVLTRVDRVAATMR